MVAVFTPQHRGGSGPPLVCLHGFADTWRTWELLLPALERRHDVLAPTLAGHAGGPPLPAGLSESTLADDVERAMEAAGFSTAHLVGNSLGGFVALQLAARGRARSVVALAPGGGWLPGDAAALEALSAQAELHERMRVMAPRADALLATEQGRRRASAWVAESYEHIPSALLSHQMLGVAACTGAPVMLALAARSTWELDFERIDCPVRIVWGTGDRLLPWPSSAERYRRGPLAHADWVELDGVGHSPQLDVPEVTAALILEVTAG